MAIPRGTFSDYLLVVRRPQAAAFLSASLISGAGSALTTIAVPIAVYQMTSSLAALGTTWVIRIVVSFITLPLAGVVADRYDRRKTMVVSNYASILADGLMLLGFVAPDLRLLMAGLAVLQAANRFHGPASAALFPRFFAPDELPVANSAKAAVGQVVSLAAPALGGLLAHGWGIAPLFVLDAVSFLVAAVIIARIRLNTEARTRDTSRPGSPTAAYRVRSFVVDMRDGLLASVASTPALVYLVTGAVGAASARLVDVIGVPLTLDVLRLGPQGLGYLYSAMAAGSLVAIVLLPLARLERADFRVYGLFEALSAGLMIVFAVSRHPLLSLGSLGVRACLDTISGVMLDTQVQKEICPSRLGRVSSAIFLSYVVGSLVGVGLAAGAGAQRATTPFVVLAALTGMVGVWVARAYPLKDPSLPRSPHIRRTLSS